MIVGMIAQPREYTQNHRTVHFTRVSVGVHTLYRNKAVILKQTADAPVPLVVQGTFHPIPGIAEGLTPILPTRVIFPPTRQLWSLSDSTS